MKKRQSLKLLRDSLREKFSDEMRKSVLVVGSGLHNHLKSLSVMPDWRTLVRTIRKKNKLSRGEDSPDLTSAWESLVCELVERQRGRNKNAAYLIEKNLLCGDLLDLITNQVGASMALKDLAAELFSKHRDIVTLNFDRTIDSAISVNNSEMCVFEKVVRRVGPKARVGLHIKLDKQRIWHPHGVAHSKSTAASIQLGLHGYALAAQQVSERVVQFRARQQKWLDSQEFVQPNKWTKEIHKKWEIAVRELRPKSDSKSPDYHASWVDICMLSDLIFVGCGLQRVELDLWILLHARQRQFAKVSAKDRPKAFYLCVDDPGNQDLQYILKFRPAGIIPIVFKDFDDLWGFLKKQTKAT